MVSPSEVNCSIENHGKERQEPFRRTLLALAVSQIMFAGYAEAAPFIVENNADSGPGSLRAAIALANANPDTDTISFDAAHSITLTSGELTISENLTIDGDLNDDGTPDVTVSGGGNSGVFVVNSATATLDGLDIRDGDDSGVFSDHSNLTVSNSRISNNQGGFGGGIGNKYGQLTVSNSTITGNTAVIGGGIANKYGQLSVTNSSISGNYAYYGGGVASHTDAGYGPATASIADSTVSGNTAFLGGGISSLVVARPPAGTGAGVSSLAVPRAGSPIDTIISNSTITGNMAKYAGGGVSNAASASTAVFSILSSTISDNTAGYYGGGIYNAAAGNPAGPGSAIATVTNSTISGNSATAPFSTGGGVDNYTAGFSGADNAELNLVNSTLSGNSSAGSGGGVSNTSIIGQATASFTNSTFFANTAPTAFGAGVDNYAISGTAVLAMRNSIIAGSSAGADCEDSTGGPVTNVNNLIGDNTCSPAFSGDPKLGALQNNGGPTQTHALLPDSLAIDRGDNPSAAALANDQRGPGFERITNGTVDIGAFEYKVPSIPTLQQWIQWPFAGLLAVLGALRLRRRRDTG